MRIYLASYPVFVVMMWRWIVSVDVSVSRLWWCLSIPSKGFSGDIVFVVSHFGEYGLVVSCRPSSPSEEGCVLDLVEPGVHGKAALYGGRGYLGMTS